MRTTRRRFIGITAAAGGLSLLPFGPVRATPQLRVWSGAALGCDATLQIHHPDPATADRLIASSLAEVERLERVISLYRPESALCRLNRDGVLDDPPLDLVRVLAESRYYGALTGGAFDVTVQPLWNLYSAHFSEPQASPDGPTADAVAKTVARVGQEALEVDPRRLRLTRPGMGVTLNGIGQGYITDRVVELLRAGGIEHALVDMGKTRAIGGHPGGGPWSVGLEDPRAPGTFAETHTAGRPGSRHRWRLRHTVRRGRTFQPHLRAVERAHKLALVVRLGRGGHCDRVKCALQRIRPDAGGGDGTAGARAPPRCPLRPPGRCQAGAAGIAAWATLPSPTRRVVRPQFRRSATLTDFEHCFAPRTPTGPRSSGSIALRHAGLTKINPSARQTETTQRRQVAKGERYDDGCWATRPTGRRPRQ